MFDFDRYLNLIDSLYPRLISQIDRDPDSPTYGSCDRNYWMYKIHDFNSGVFQQISLTLATLVDLSKVCDFSNCRNLKAKHVEYWRTLAESINRFTLKEIKRKHGLDEYFPGEVSFPTTAFACYAALKSAQILNQTEVLSTTAFSVIAKRFLKQGPTPAANQDIASASFLGLYGKIFEPNNHKIKEAIKNLCERKAYGGLFLEYGGFDVGYATVTLNYLSYLQVDGFYDCSGEIEKLGTILSRFVTPAGSLGGEFASRSTTYFLPFGIVRTAFTIPQLSAKFSALDLISSFERLDDRYLMHYCFPSLAQAAYFLIQNKPSAQRKSNKDWDIVVDEGLKIASFVHPRSAIHLALNKGGSFFLELNNQVRNNCGYRLSRGGKIFSTNVVDDNPIYRFEKTQEGELRIEITSRFFRYKPMIPSPVKTIILRILSFMGPTLNSYFKKILIKKPQEADHAHLKRSLQFDFVQGSVSLVDKFEGIKSGDQVTTSPSSSFRLVPSAKFLHPGEEDEFLRALKIVNTNLVLTETIKVPQHGEA